MIIASSLGVLTLVYLWILWDIILSGWENVDISLDIEELESDLYHGLHLRRGDDD